MVQILKEFYCNDFELHLSRIHLVLLLEGWAACSIGNTWRDHFRLCGLPSTFTISHVPICEESDEGSEIRGRINSLLPGDWEC